MEAVLAIAFLSFVGLSQETWYSDETACVGDQSVKFYSGSPDDPLTIRFDCAGKEGKEDISFCNLDGVATYVEEGKHKSLTLPSSGNTYELRCYSSVAPTIFWVLAPGICKSDSPKATIGLQDSSEKMDVSFKCNLLKKISKCIVPVGDSKKSFSPSDKTEGRFGGRSGRKYVITCKEVYAPTIREDYSAERCYEKTNFVDSITVTGTGKGSGEKIEVEFTCAKGMIVECRPPGGNVISANSIQASFKKGNAEFKLSCFGTSAPIITPKKST